MTGQAIELAEDVLHTGPVDDAYRSAASDPLGVLLQALLDEPELPSTSFENAVERCRNDVRRVAALQADRRTYPEIEDVEVARPLFILGMPRCGTSILQALLGADPGARMLRQWEWAHYSPPPRPVPLDDPRITAMDAAMTSSGASAMRVMHPVGPVQPLECGPLLECSFRSTMFNMDLRLAPYLEWYLQSDSTPAYELHRRWLEHFQLHHNPTHWVLKIQEHMYHAPELQSVYPDAMLVQPHRDPATVIASIASLIATLRRRTFIEIDPAALGQEMLHLWGSGLTKFMEFRDANPQVRVCDVRYRDIVNDPVGTVKLICSFFELDWTDSTADRVAQWWTENPPDKDGIHHYSLDDWDLTETVVNDYFAAYRAAYGDWI